MREEIAAGKIPGAVVVVGINDRIVLRQAYGNRSVVPTVQPATLDTVYDAASLTKVMATSVAILQLVERGKPKLVAIIATARKLLTILNAILRDNKPWKIA